MDSDHVTLTQSFARRFLERATESERIVFPSERYLHNVEAFANQILGVRFWSKQKDFASLVQENDRVAAKAGQKVSKTYTAVILALWYFCCYPDAQVYVTAPSYQQLKRIFWRVLGILIRQSGTCLACREKGIRKPCSHSAKIEGVLGLNPDNGFICGDRQIVGISTNDPDHISGRSGAHMFWIVDEAIGVPAANIEAIQGTLAGGGKFLIVSNPTEMDVNNEFCLAFTKKKDLYKTLTISSLDSPNITGEGHFPGLASKAWAEEKKVEWGEDSAEYQSRVLGEFSLRSTTGLISLLQIKAAQVRWDTMLDQDGPLVVGLDLASASTGNDKTTFAIRRGFKVLELGRFEGLDSQEILEKLLEYIDQYKHDGDVPLIYYDALNTIGKHFADEINMYIRKYPNTIYARGLAGNGDPPNSKYDRLRDYALANMCEVLKKDVGIPYDDLLEEELASLRWDIKKSDLKGKDKVIDKKDLRKQLGRSTDISDALAYCLFEIDRDGIKRLTTNQQQEEKKRKQQQQSPYQQTKQYNPYKRSPQYPSSR